MAYEAVEREVPVVVGYVTCPECYQAVEWRGPGKGWFHVRAGSYRCIPMCDHGDCQSPAKHATGREVFAGFGMRFRPERWWCDEHIPADVLTERR